MKRFIVIIFIAGFTVSHARAQERATKAISAGLELNIPQRSAFNVGYGVSEKLELPVTSAVSVVLAGGINQFHYKSFRIGNAANRGNDTFIPLKAGIKYFLDPRFYTEGELGTVIDHNKEYSQNLFAYSFGTGFLLPLNGSKSNMIDIGLRFEDWSKNRAQQFAIRVAYRFAW